jgi:hypothetical protein
MKRLTANDSGRSPQQGARCSYWSGAALVLVMILTLAISAMGQQPPDKPVTPAKQGEIIDSVCKTLNEVYVFPDVAKNMEKHVRKLYKNRRYANITGLRQFGDTLTADLLSICHDKHLGVRFVPDGMVAQLSQDTLTDEGRKREQEQLQRNNYYFKEVKILNGNVGYLKFNQFAGAADAGATAIASLNFLAYTDAIIIDLRENGGGDPSMIQLITSYFVKEPTHLNSFYIRRTGATDQFWTQAWVPGPRMTETDLYVLTSNYTFSGAEEFTYNMKNLKRATIIGETTGGGAHPVERHLYANLNFGIQIPFGRAVNPITNTNWEGTGIAPDIAVPQDKALTTAHTEALKKLRERTTDELAKASLTWAIDGLQAGLNPIRVDNALLQKYAGKYGPRSITLENGVLFYQREGRPKYKMSPISNDTFSLDELNSFRLKFVTNQNGAVTEVVGQYDDGHTDASPRTAD